MRQFLYEAVTKWRGFHLDSFAISGKAFLRPEWDLGWRVRLAWRKSWLLIYVRGEE